MRVTRIHAVGPLATGGSIVLPEAGGYHLARVLRLKEGAPLIVFDGTGGEYRASILSVAGSAVRVRLGEFTANGGAPPLRLALVQGISRGERMDWTLQKATELGISSIVPVLAARSVVKLDDRQKQKKHEHWRAVVVSACEQCGRTDIPGVAEPLTLRAFLARSRSAGLRLALSPDAPDSLAGLADVPDHVELLIGPEGGLDDKELTLAGQAGFVLVRLGPRVLRTETAAVVALSVLQAKWGDLR